MECYSCGELGAISTGCCNLFAHPKCIEEFNNYSNRVMEQRYECVQCKKQFGSAMATEIRRLRVTAQVSSPIAPSPIVQPPNVPNLVYVRRSATPVREAYPEEIIDAICAACASLNPRRRKIILILFLIFLVIYIPVGIYLVEKYHNYPRRIENNQKLILCESDNIVCENNIVKKAYAKDGTDITHIFIIYQTEVCPTHLEEKCWNYKKHYSRDGSVEYDKAKYTGWFCGFPAAFYTAVVIYLIGS
jgi:hypothetical protein